MFVHHQITALQIAMHDGRAVRVKVEHSSCRLWKTTKGQRRYEVERTGNNAVRDSSVSETNTLAAVPS